MSRILRRPMFRGGQVIDSRGTGITSGLMDGGRVGYQNAGFVTGGQLMAAANSFPELNMFKNIKLNPKSKFIVGQGNTINGFDVDKVASFIGGEGDLAFASTDSFSYPMGTDTTQLGETTEKPDNLIASKDTDKLKIGKTNEVDIMDDTTMTGTTETEKFKSPTMEIKEKEFSGEIDTTPTIITDEKDEEPKIEDPDKDIKDMADRYFELMGGGKAFSRDVGDMLLRFAGAEGETTSDKFKAYLRDEAKAGPSRTEKIKDAAAKTAINYQTQKEFLEKKIASSESIAEKNIAAQALRDLNKTYAPGITQKKIEYLKSLNPNSKEYKLALGDLGLATSFDAQINSDQMSGQPVTIETADTYASIYYPNYKGKLTENSKSGMFLDVANKRLIIVDDTGNFEVFKTLQIQ
tara:strand:- start:1410 stop:2630 length:1221 start_codon:yes stop_codon:yes gene_type:complete